MSPAPGRLTAKCCHGGCVGIGCYRGGGGGGGYDYGSGDGGGCGGGAPCCRQQSNERLPRVLRKHAQGAAGHKQDLAAVPRVAAAAVQKEARLRLPPASALALHSAN